MKKGRTHQIQTPVKKWQQMSPMEDELAIYESDLSSPQQPSLFHSLVAHTPFPLSPQPSSCDLQEEFSQSHSYPSFPEPESMEEELSLSVSDMKVQPSEPIERTPLKPLDTNRKGCHCRNSKCQKNYCDCWRLGLVCDPKLCVCEDCHNTEEKDTHRRTAEKLEKTAFVMKGCRCLKSKCLKKYCECYCAGRKCTQLCECIECHNRDENFNPSNFGLGMKKTRNGAEGPANIYLM